MLWAEVQRQPMQPLHKYAETLNSRGYAVDEKYVQACFLQLLIQTRLLCRWVEAAFKRLGLSDKTAKHRNINKFTQTNAIYTVRYLTGIQQFEWTRLKFFDEVRLVCVAFLTRAACSRASIPASSCCVAGPSEGDPSKSLKTSSTFGRIPCLA